MKTLLALLMLLPFGTLAQSHNHDHAGHSHAADTAKAAPNEVFRFVEQMPEAPYNVAAYIEANIVPPPNNAASYNYRVTVQFIVDEVGKITNPIALNAGRVPFAFKDEAIRVVKSMPDWKPGKQNGRPVKVYYTLPVNFKTVQDIPVSEKTTENQLTDLPPKEMDHTGVYKFVDEMPEPGYDINMCIYNRIKIPAHDYRYVRIMTRFVVTEDGSLTRIETMNPMPEYEKYEAEARRVVKLFPKWKHPGKMKGQLVKVYYTVPIVFRQN
jgi:Gram-negative bacterial tonB protein.